MDKTQLQWLLTGLGVAIAILIYYLWGIRSRIREEIGKRRRRSAREPVVFSDQPDEPDALRNAHDFGDLGRITPNHHLAGKALVDVEIRPVAARSASREASPDDPPSEPFAFEPPALESPAEFSTDDSVEFSTDDSAEFSTDDSMDKPLDMTVALTVLAPPDQPFEGPRIQAVAEELDLRLNASGVFERFPSGEMESDTPVFSVAHLRKPGAFDPTTLPEMSTPGLLLYMSLPGPLEGTEALDLLVINADHLARNLGGTICDEQHNRLTNPMLLELHQQVADLERRWLAQLDD